MIGFGARCTADKATLYGVVIKAHTIQNSKAALMSAIHKAAYDGTTNRRRFYKTPTTSLKDIILGKNNDKDLSLQHS